ncbi:uncharacterized protein LOC143281507 [Babylonia areolata]|uniref:uncharacterized protein LOC143281507 n=1 Tax=Babylonia areolata TaxID=304850 RepID=UPI003FD423B9
MAKESIGPRLPVLSRTRKASGENPEEKSGVGAPKAVGRCTDFLPAAPAAKLVPNVSLCVPSDCIGEAERGILKTGQPRISINFAQGHALERKTVIIDRELTRLNIDIAALQETRLPLISGSLREQNYTFFWQGKELEEPRLRGVGFAIRNSLLSSVELPYSGTARILALCLSTSSGPVNLLSVYAPTLCSSAETKDQFYEELHTIFRNIPATEQLYLLGIFNARKGRPRINTVRTAIPNLCDRFASSIEDDLKDCPAPSKKTLAVLKKARNDTKRIARRCAKDYWLNFCQNFQLSAVCGNIRGMYDGMKKAFGPCVNKIAPLKSASSTIITDRSNQVDRWAEHYQELYSRENIVADAAAESITNLPVMEEIDIPPSEEELSKAIDSLTCGKAPGKDGIPPEVIKAGEKTALLHHLHQLLLQCWEEGTVPKEMRDANIITLYKNRDDCNNYLGISLLSIVGKTFARVVLCRLQLLSERVYPKAQCGFRAGRSTIDMVFSMRQLQEKCWEQRRPLYVTFIDLTKAFDLVSRKGFFTLLQKI